MKVLVVGGGYIGSQLARAASCKGHEVFVSDKVRERNCAWRAGKRQEVEDCNMPQAILICVNTPPEGPDLVEKVLSALPLPRLHPKRLLSIEASTPPGFTVAMATRLGLGDTYHVCHSSERLWPGRESDWPIEKIPKLVGGMTPEATAAGFEFYSTFIERVIPVSSPTVSEFAKLYENCQRSVNIAWAREAREFALKLGIDFEEVLMGCRTKPFGYSDFYPGEIGGTCLPANTTYLLQEAQEKGLRFDLLATAWRIGKPKNA